MQKASKSTKTDQRTSDNAAARGAALPWTLCRLCPTAFRALLVHRKKMQRDLSSVERRARRLVRPSAAVHQRNRSVEPSIASENSRPLRVKTTGARSLCSSRAAGPCRGMADCSLRAASASADRELSSRASEAFARSLVERGLSRTSIVSILPFFATLELPVPAFLLRVIQQRSHGSARSPSQLLGAHRAALIA